MKQIFSVLLVIIGHTASSMYIPQDIEILDGYDVEEPLTVYPQDESYYEPKIPIRNKRSPLYHVLESPGLKSHFHKNHDVVKRTKRSDSTTKEGSDSETAASLPVAEKQVMEGEYYRKGSWNVHSFNTDYSKPQQQDEEDSLAEATINEGIKGRTPRVNFITQSKKKMDEGVIGTSGGDPLGVLPHPASVSARDYVRSTMIPKLYNTKSRYEKLEGRMSDNYEHYPSRSYDPYLRRYDRYDDQYNRYDPYYENYYINRRRYDPYDSYSPRMPGYPEPYYEYPDSRYDVPEPRDYRPFWFNDIYNRMPYPTYPTTYENRNRRIIYYAHLPEVIRAPPSVDLTYRYAPTPQIASATGYSLTNPLAGAYRQSVNGQTNRGGSSLTPDSMAFVKREKKDFRNYTPNYKNAMNVAAINNNPNQNNNNNNNNNNSNKEHRE